MPYFTYDTSVCISRKLTNFHEMPHDFLMSAVVQMELISSAHDESRRKLYEEAFRQRSQRGKLQRLPPGASQRLALDTLIAVSARRWRAQVITENWADFKAIQRYCNTTIIRAAEFFKK